MLYEIDKEDTSPSIFLCIFLSFRYLMNYFAQIYRAQYGAAILVYLQGRLITKEVVVKDKLK